MSHILYLKTVDIVKKFFSDSLLHYILLFLNYTINPNQLSAGRVDYVIHSTTLIAA
jgi:hypothetical protein